MSLFTSRVVALSLASVLGVTTLTGCGSSSSATSPQGRPGFGLSAAQQKKIQQCLKAAGLASAFPSGQPSGFPSDGPSGSPPTGFPSGSPSDLPSGGPSGGPGGAFNTPQVRAALKACGLTLPEQPLQSGNAG